MKKWAIAGAIIGTIHFFSLAFVPLAQKIWVATFPLGAVILNLDRFFSPFICQLSYIVLCMINIVAFAGVGYCLAFAIRRPIDE